jgi:hypothetical protein
MMDALAMVVDVTVVTALALFACRLLRRRSASLRHAVLTAALAAAAIAPLLEVALPRWEIAVLSGAAPVTASAPSVGVDAPPPVAVAADSPDAAAPMC